MTILPFLVSHDSFNVNTSSEEVMTSPSLGLLKMGGSQLIGKELKESKEHQSIHTFWRASRYALSIEGEHRERTKRVRKGDEGMEEMRWDEGDERDMVVVGKGTIKNEIGGRMATTPTHTMVKGERR